MINNINNILNDDGLYRYLIKYFTKYNCWTKYDITKLITNSKQHREEFEIIVDYYKMKKLY